MYGALSASPYLTQPDIDYLGLYELRFYELYESPTDLPSTSWWLERRSLAGVQAEAWAWARVAMAEELVEAGFDESQIDGILSDELLAAFFLRYYF